MSEQDLNQGAVIGGLSETGQQVPAEAQVKIEKALLYNAAEVFHDLYEGVCNSQYTQLREKYSEEKYPWRRFDTDALLVLVGGHEKDDLIIQAARQFIRINELENVKPGEIVSVLKQLDHDLDETELRIRKWAENTPVPDYYKQAVKIVSIDVLVDDYRSRKKQHQTAVKYMESDRVATQDERMLEAEVYKLRYGDFKEESADLILNVKKYRNAPREDEDIHLALGVFCTKNMLIAMRQKTDSKMAYVLRNMVNRIYDWREIWQGKSDDKFIEFKKGNPLDISELSDYEKDEVTGVIKKLILTDEKFIEDKPFLLDVLIASGLLEEEVKK